MHSWSLSALELLLFLLFDLFAFYRSLGLFVENFYNLFFYGLLYLVEHDRRLHVKGLLLGHLVLGVVVLDVKEVQVTVAGAVHPAETTVDWVPEDAVSRAVPVSLVNSLAASPVEDVDGLAGDPYYVLSILNEHAAVEVFVLPPLGSLEGRDSILLVKRDLLGAGEVTVISIVDLDNKSLDFGVERIGVVGSHNPQFVVEVMHLRRAQVAESGVAVTDRGLDVFL